MKIIYDINLDRIINSVKKKYPYYSYKEKDYLYFKKKYQKKLSKLNKKKIIKFLYNNKINKIPNISFGNITTLNLFELDELIIFLFYKDNKWKYENAIDIGANIGLHSIILSNLGYKTISFEPDPKTFLNLKKIIKLNNSKKIKIKKNAISNKDKVVFFNRILNNLTGSHISGSKNYLYGPIEKFKVKAKNLNNFLTNKSTIVKIDAEGQEANIICSINKKFLKHVDIMCEINNQKNAYLIFKYCKKMKLSIFTQKNNWKICKNISCLSNSYKEGSVFISLKNRPFDL